MIHLAISLQVGPVTTLGFHFQLPHSEENLKTSSSFLAQQLVRLISRIEKPITTYDALNPQIRGKKLRRNPSDRKEGR
jgi:hypothetical protein